jgi:predicted TIM-barrel fold metal-dependent hydrolase
MIVDADTHISPTPQGGNSLTSDELLRCMDRAGVDKALTWLQPPYLRNETSAGNAYVHRAMREHPDRILGFGWLDPHLGHEWIANEIRRGVEEYGFYGFKLNGAQNGFVIDDPELVLPVVEAVAQTGKVLAFHIGADAPENTHPTRLGAIARRYPALRLIMVHMGGAAYPDLSRTAIEVASEYPNITIVGSAIGPIPILDAIRTFGPERICFGSDTPFELMRVELAKYRALLDGEIVPDDQAKILAGNLLRLLRIETSGVTLP